MCVCVYVCMYICMYVCMYVRMYVRMYVCMYVGGGCACMRACVCHPSAQQTWFTHSTSDDTAKA